MTPGEIRDAALLLFDLWQAGEVTGGLPPHLSPASRTEGYAIQAAFAERAESDVFGWKIAATSAAGQAHIGVDGPLAGRILRRSVIPDGGTVPPVPNRMAVAEVEYAFRMGRALPPRAEAYTQDDVLDAVAALHAAIELPDSRYADFVTAGAAQLIADNACGHFFVLGTSTAAGWRTIDLAAHRPTGRVEGGLRREGLGAYVLGDPRVALTWLANELSRHGITLEEGHVVTTGTAVVPMPVRPGDMVFADLGAIGTASVTLARPL